MSSSAALVLVGPLGTITIHKKLQLATGEQPSCRSWKKDIFTLEKKNLKRLQRWDRDLSRSMHF